MHKVSLALLAAAALLLPGGAVAQQNKLTVGLPTTPPNVVHMPVIIARELGLYKKYGVEVETVQLEDGVKVFRAMLAGNIDIGMSPGAVTIIGRSNGAAIKNILANSNKFEASMVVRDNVKDMADLKGKRIGIQQPGGFADLLARAVLRAAKIDPKDVNFVTIASEDVPALVADQVDTAMLHVEQEMLAKSKVPTLHAIARMDEEKRSVGEKLLSVTDAKEAERVHAELAAHARREHLGARLDRHPPDVRHAGEADRAIHLPEQPVPRHARAPFLLGLQRHHRLEHAERRGIRRCLGAPGLAEDVVDLGELFEHPVLRLDRGPRLGDRHAGQRRRHVEDRPLVQRRHELGPEPEPDRDREGDDQHGRDDRQPAEAQDDLHDRVVEAHERAADGVGFLTVNRADEDRVHHTAEPPGAEGERIDTGEQ